ncbi:aspartyl aminopeptidase [Coccidioides posadasii str. Silveira]|uniref:aspartyl aminopeptidase n=3 Tax=Coccidioides TaxID=5500 RepID=E9DGH9_COCPS|nr:aspartyl aminopeptidase [Coccidioides posadasii str. Silveira]
MRLNILESSLARTSQLSQTAIRTATNQPYRAHSTMTDFKEKALDFCSFVNASPTPFHAVASARTRLVDAGFKEIKEKDAWSSICKPGGKYYLTRNGSTIIAFAVGRKWKPGNSIAMLGAHTDSPCLRVKPVSKKRAEGFIQIGVETYGGGLWHTWFDRDLGIAGRVMARNNDGSISARLLRIDRPILRIPTLAIHFERQETFSFNKETQLFPIAGLVEAELSRVGGDHASTEPSKSEDKTDDAPTAPLKVITERHHPYLIELMASELALKPDDIVDFEILLYDTQKACLGGLLDEFIFSARLDNLNMSYCATMGFIESLSKSSALDNETSIRLVALFDHEEIGSKTAQGADSNALPAILRRLAVLPSSGKEDTSTAYEQSLSTSFLLSADMSHSVNPNYAFKYEPDHKPEMNKGPVIKINANARYATNSPGIVLVQEAARLAKSGGDTANTVGVPLQLFVVRNDSLCGSTIGPMLSAALGTRTVDLGNAQLSMHSIRETGGTKDVGYAVRLFKSFFENFSQLSQRIFVD